MDENILRIHELILKDHLHINEQVDMFGVSWSFCQQILNNEFKMKRAEAKFCHMCS